MDFDDGWIVSTSVVGGDESSVETIVGIAV